MGSIFLDTLYIGVQSPQMNNESATGTFVFKLVFEKYTKENIFQLLNAMISAFHTQR